MSRRERISPIVRVISGVIGILGFAAIAFKASKDGGIKLDFMLFASFFAGFIFVYVSIFGKYPWDSKSVNDTDN